MADTLSLNSGRFSFRNIRPVTCAPAPFRCAPVPQSLVAVRRYTRSYYHAALPPATVQHVAHCPRADITSCYYQRPSGDLPTSRWSLPGLEPDVAVPPWFAYALWSGFDVFQAPVCFMQCCDVSVGWSQASSRLHAALNSPRGAAVRACSGRRRAGSSRIVACGDRDTRT